MQLPNIINAASEYFQIPPAITFLGPIAIALTLQIVKSAEARQKIHDKGAWKGMKVEKENNSIIPTLCALIFIVSMTYISYFTLQGGSPTYIVSNVVNMK